MSKTPKGPVGPVGPTNPIRPPAKLAEQAEKEGQTTHMLADQYASKMADIMYPTHRKKA